jgi:hypothetical protein
MTARNVDLRVLLRVPFGLPASRMLRVDNFTDACEREGTVRACSQIKHSALSSTPTEGKLCRARVRLSRVRKRRIVTSVDGLLRDDGTRIRSTPRADAANDLTRAPRKRSDRG